MMGGHISKAQVKWVRSLQQKKFRDEEGVFVAEGEKCVRELEKSFALELLVTPENATAIEIAQMSSLRTPQGVIGVFRKPIDTESDSTLCVGKARRDLVLALDGVQDPGNVGTIIRTCDWFGIRDLYCSHDTADCYSPKVIQSTMGSIARVRVHYVDLEEVLEAVRSASIPIYGTLLDGKDLYAVGAIPAPRSGVIVMGNEGKGLSADVRAKVSHPLLIPAYKQEEEHAESLNVSIATAVVLAEFRRLSR